MNIINDIKKCKVNGYLYNKLIKVLASNLSLEKKYKFNCLSGNYHSPLIDAYKLTKL